MTSAPHETASPPGAEVDDRQRGQRHTARSHASGRGRRGNARRRCANPLIETASPVVGGVVGTRRIEELPLNGRQFANLAATLPGPATRSIAIHQGTQYTPQVSGGSGRNVNYLVDGGDNNDDTVGGQLQMFPLDSIDEFRFSIAGYGAATGRSGGGVMNVVTKSGTNRLSGSGLLSSATTH